jgi:hypothetical protein
MNDWLMLALPNAVHAAFALNVVAASPVQLVDL